jgi:hypothetical protein
LRALPSFMHRSSTRGMLTTHRKEIFAYSIRVAVLILVLVPAAAVPKPIIIMGPPHQVQTVNPKMGVHTRLTDEVEEWKIQRTLALVREMGAPWIVEYFPWGYIEPARGQFNWEHADTVVNHAVNQGLTVIARLDFVPEWARPENTTFRHLDEENYQDYGNFVYAFVDHFKGRVDYFIIWNEPNLSFEWGYRPVDPEAYTELLKLAYTRAKEANPDCYVLSGGLAPTIAREGNEWGLSDLIFLQRMYDAGAKDYFDIVAIHAYGYVFPPDDPPAENKINFARAELIREVMVRNGDADKKIMITEAGWNDHPRWTKAVRPYQRTIYTLQAYERAKEWQWCQALVVWSFRTPVPEKNFRDYYTLVTSGFIVKPIYLEIQDYAHGATDWLTEPTQ